MDFLGIGYASPARDASIIPCGDIEELERTQQLDPDKCYKYTGKTTWQESSPQ